MNTIRFQIFKEDRIGDIQEKFSDLFPVLWIKIFKHMGSVNPVTTQNLMFCPEVKMSDINPNFRDGMLMLSGKMTVSELEQIFYNKFGLSVQVSQRNGSPVMESSMMKDFLFKHNNRREYEGFPAFGEAVYFQEVPYGC
ncbi:MAG TPA: hypothetical protein VII44_01840 [Puia sp.]